MRRKVTVSFTIELEQLERIDHAVVRLRLNRSEIARAAFERELERLAEVPDAPRVEASQLTKQGSAATPKVASSRR